MTLVTPQQPTRTNPADIDFMKKALETARTALGSVAPNPAVGCVLVKDNAIISAGATQPGGRPHAETVALQKAGVLAKGCTAYVTLEPCAHQGQTPPCVDALIEAGIARTVIACEDPDPRTHGAGIQKLQDAGIEVTVGVCAAEAQEINRGFFLNLQENRPLISMKVAMSLDGKIACSNGKSKWITGEKARHEGHILRKTHDAILVGAGTVLKDNPYLTCRLDEFVSSKSDSPQHEDFLSGPVLDPIPVLLDKDKKITNEYNMFSGKSNVIVYHKDNSNLDQSGRLDLDFIIKDLAAKGITRLLVEGGAKVLTSFLKANFFDELYLFRSPKIMGNDALSAFGDLELVDPNDAPTLSLYDVRRLGDDVLEVYLKKTLTEKV